MTLLKRGRRYETDFAKFHKVFTDDKTHCLVEITGKFDKRVRYLVCRVLENGNESIVKEFGKRGRKSAVALIATL